MKNLLLRGLIVILCIFMSVGCASIMHGTSQDIQIMSSPDDAEVWIDGANFGKTPARVNLSRKKDYLITIKKGGYKDATVKVEGKTSSWIIGNIIFGGFIGCGIDFISGGAYDLTPEILSINLSKLSAMNGQTISLPQYAFDRLEEIRFIDKNGNTEITISIIKNNHKTKGAGT